MKKTCISKQTIALISFIILIIDQATKILLKNFIPEGLSKPFIPGIINIHLTKNTGAAFSLFSESTALLAILSLLVSLGILYWLLRAYYIKFWKGIGIAFLLAGTLGNGLDRWRLGYVTDFIQIIPIKFPIFNIADIAINFAIIFLILDSFKSERFRRIE